MVRERCEGKQVYDYVHNNYSRRGITSVLDETSIRTSRPGLMQANGSRSLERPLGRHGRRRLTYSNTPVASDGADRSKHVVQRTTRWQSTRKRSKVNHHDGQSSPNDVPIASRDDIHHWTKQTTDVDDRSRSAQEPVDRAAPTQWCRTATQGHRSRGYHTTWRRTVYDVSKSALFHLASWLATSCQLIANLGWQTSSYLQPGWQTSCTTSELVVQLVVRSWSNRYWRD